MKRLVFSALLLMAGVLTSSAAVNVQGWYHLGEVADYYADSTTNNRRMASAYSHVPWNNPAYGGNFSGIITPTAVGGPLGTSGYTSTQSLRSGTWGTMICTMWNAAGYAPPANNYYVEMWVQPHGKGYVYGTSGAWIIRVNTVRGLGLRVRDNGDGTSSYVGTIIESPNVDVGNAVLIDTNAWAHLALVKDNGIVTFYVNGVPSGASDSTSSVSAPSGDVQFGSDSAGYDGLMDEARICTFDAGTFTTNYFLLRPLGPQILTQPQNAVVWNGGSAPFTVGAVIDAALTYQWQRESTNLPGATAASLYLPQVALADTASQFRSVLTANSISVTSSVATLTVLPNRTEDVNFYRAAVTAEPSLAAYFTADNCLGSTLTNVVDASRNGTLEGVVSYDGRTNRAFGQRAVSFNGNGNVQIPSNPAFEFSSGNGTIEAAVRLESGGAQDGTIFALAYDGSTVGYALLATRDGSQLIYSNDSPAILSWPVPASLIGRLAHVALVIDNTTNVTAIVDGQSLGTKTQPGLGAAGGASAWIGALGAGPVRRFNGTIDEVAVYGSALSLNTIQVHYSRFVYGTNVSAPSIVSQPGSRTVLAGAAPILQVQVAGTLPISYQWTSNGVAIPGAVTAKHTVTGGPAATAATYALWATNAIGWTNTQPITLTFAAPSGVYASAVLQDRPSSYWRLGESSGTVAVDSAGYNDASYTGSLTYGVPSTISTDPDTAVQFTGGNAPVPYTPTLNPANAFTLECFVKPDQSGQNQRSIAGSQNRNVGRSGYALYQGFNGNFWESHIGDSTTVTMFLQGTSPVVAGRWYHLALVYDPNDPAANGRLYVNGVQEASALGNFLPNNQQPFTIAGRQSLGNYPGTIDELAFYNYALTGAQISNHWRFSWVASAITQQPVGVTNSEWSTVSMTVAASGYPNTYQWYKVGTGALSDVDNSDGTRHYPNGVTNTTFTIAQAHPADSGQYYVVVVNALGGSQSVNATVLVTPDTTKPTVAFGTALPTPNPNGTNPYAIKITFSEVVDAASAGTLANYSVSGVTLNGVTVSANNRSAYLATSGLVPGQKYTVNVSGIKDQAQTPLTMDPAVVTVWSPVLSQGVNWDYYANITPQEVASLINSPYYPLAPYTNVNFTAFDSGLLTGGDLNNKPGFPAPLGENYGASLSGWITPTVTTNYYFFITSDDASELFLSTTANPADAVSIAVELDCCDGFLEPGTDPATSAAIPLTAGVSYFIRALQTEGGGGDYVRVAWKMEGDPAAATSLQPISGSVLKAYAQVPAPQFNPPSYNAGSGQLTISWAGVGVLYQSTNLVNWTPVPGNPPSPYVVSVTAEPILFYRVVRQ